MRLKRTIVILMASSLSIFAQPAASSGLVVSVESFTHVVQDVEKSARFYRDTLGLEVIQSPTQFSTITWVNAVGDTPGAQIRIATFRAPDSPLIIELAEYKGTDRKPPESRLYQDPGVTVPIFYVRSMEIAIEKLKQTSAKIITVGGKPSTNHMGKDVVDDLFVQDPDGFFFGLSHHQPLPPTTAPASSNIIGESLEFVVNNLDETLRIHKDIFGFAMPPSSQFVLFEPVNEGGNTPGASIRTSNGPLPGRSHANFGSLRYLEYKDVIRAPLHTRLQDPGSTVLRLRVRDLAVTMKQLKAAGVYSVTKGGQPVVMDSSQYFMIRDPDNVYVDLVQRGKAE